MKLIRYEKNTFIYYGELIDNSTVERINGDIFGEYTKSGITEKIDACKVLSPTVPSKIVAVGKNYIDHAKELGGEIPNNPIIFIKPPTTIIANEEDIIYPSISNRVDYEGELAVVIKKKARNVKKSEAKNYILGYTCLNDVTARDIQTLDGQWTRAKCFDTFAPVGPIITDEIDPDNVYIETLLNGEVKQSSNTSMMIWKVDELIEFISAVMTLNPGDIITTGTPSGIGPMKKGDRVEVRIEGIGSLVNFVK